MMIHPIAFFRNHVYLSVTLSTMLVFYIVFCAAVSIRYGALTVHPTQLFYEAKLMASQVFGGQSLETDSEYSYASRSAVIEAIRGSAAGKPAVGEKEHLAGIQSMLSDESGRKYTVIEKTSLPTKIQFESIDASALSGMELIDDQSQEQAEYFSDLAEGPNEAPTQADIDALLAKRAAPSAEQAIPATVLQRVEESTGISPEEVNALLEQE